MRSITFVQAFQYWLKLTALAVPVLFLAVRWLVRIGGPSRWPAEASADSDGPRHHRAVPDLLADAGPLLGTMGLPHVLVRFYTNPDGRAARRTTLIVLALLGVFYLFPPVYGVLGRIYAPDLARRPRRRPGAAAARNELIGGTPATCSPRCHRRRLRRLPVHDLRADDRWPGCSARICFGGPRAAASGWAAVIAGGGTAGLAPDGSARWPTPSAGLRVGRIDVLPAAGARHLVARADRRRSRRRTGRGRAAAGRGGRSRLGAGGTAGLLGQPAAWTVPAAFAAMVLVRWPPGPGSRSPPAGS